MQGGPGGPYPICNTHIEISYQILKRGLQNSIQLRSLGQALLQGAVFSTFLTMKQYTVIYVALKILSEPSPSFFYYPTINPSEGVVGS